MARGKGGTCWAYCRNQVEAASRGAIKRCLKSMIKQRNNVEFQTTACDLLTKASLRTPEAFDGRSSIEAPVSILLALKIHSSNADLRYAACSAIGHLLLGVPACRFNIVKNGGIGTWVSVMDTYVTDERLVSIMAGFPSSAYRLRPELLDDLIQEGFTEAIMLAMEVHSSSLELQQQTIDALFFLSRKDQEMNPAPLPHELAVVASVLSAFNRFPYDEHIHQFGLWVLDHLVRVNLDIVHSILLHPEVNIPLVALAAMSYHHGKAEIEGIGCRILMHFFEVGALSEDVRELCFQRVMSAMEMHRGVATQCHVETARFLAKVAQNEDLSPRFFESKAIKLLLESMTGHPDEPGIHYYGCTALHSLLMRKETLNPALFSDEAAIALVAAMKLHNKDLKITERALAAIDILAGVMGQEALDIIAKAGGVEAVIAAMHHHSAVHIKWCGCSSLGRLALGRDDIKMKIATKGGVDVLLALMKKMSPVLQVSEKILEECCKTMGILTAIQHKEILQAIAKADGVNILMDAIEAFPSNKVIFNYGGSAALLVREFENEQKRRRKEGE